MDRRRLVRSLACAGALALFAATVSPIGPASADDKRPVEPLMEQWEKDTRARLEKDAQLKPLAAKYPLVILHSRHF